MVPSTGSLLRGCAVSVIILVTLSVAYAQENQASFYDVQLSPDEVYKYQNLKFTGDYISLQSPSGLLALGKTEAGVTVVIVLGAGQLSIEAPDQVQEKFKTVFGNYPAKTNFNTLYMRLNPKEYAETIGKLSLTKSPDEGAMTKAKELYDKKFLASYHAGPRAILPPYKTRVYEFDTPDMGEISTEEGYWVTLRRLSPYGSVYPSRFVNPKQK